MLTIRCQMMDLHRRVNVEDELDKGFLPGGGGQQFPLQLVQVVPPRQATGGKDENLTRGMGVVPPQHFLLDELPGGELALHHGNQDGEKVLSAQFGHQRELLVVVVSVAVDVHLIPAGSDEDVGESEGESDDEVGLVSI